MSAGTMELLDSVNHSPVKEYRINKNGKVEARMLDCDTEQGNDWAEVSPEQLSSHVKKNTVVARWLERNLGWRRLLQACVGQ
jgi:hypothetical protein